MQIFFRKIRWKNFLSTGNDFIELNLGVGGSTLIVGQNGAGKCVRKNTEVDVIFKDKETEKKFKKYLSKKSK
jgi:ABC-type Mn2+/Zn2+ transport system ATPase subunit